MTESLGKKPEHLQDPVLGPVEELLKQKRYPEAAHLARSQLHKLLNPHGSLTKISVDEELQRATLDHSDVPDYKWKNLRQSIRQVVQRLEQVIRVYGEKK